MMGWRDLLRSLPDAVPADELADALAELERARAIVLRRFLANGEPDAGPAPAPPEPDRLLAADEVAERMGTTKRYVYDHAKDWPFTRRPSPGKLRFSERGLNRYLGRRG